MMNTFISGSNSRLGVDDEEGGVTCGGMVVLKY
jgi:hypothetical protein